MPPSNRSTMERFLKEDLYDALRWFFEGAVAWDAARSRPEKCRHQCVLGMQTSLVQARALYEFFYGHEQGDDARAVQFASTWRPLETNLYRAYMAGGKPANKPAFHLVYNRSRHAVGNESGHLKNRVVEFARDLKRLTEDFCRNADSSFQQVIDSALKKALEEADLAAKYYGIKNPF